VEQGYQILVRRWRTGRALNAGERFTHTPILCVHPLAARQQKIGGGKSRHDLKWLFYVPYHVMAMSHSFGVKLQNGWSPAKEDTCCSLSVWVYACAWAWCFCVLFFSLCLSKLRSYAYVYIDSSSSLYPNCQTVCLAETRAHVESARRLAAHQTVRSGLY